MAATNRDFIATLDAAIGCQQCGTSLDRSPSDDFCSPHCQATWSAARVQPLTSYREPEDQAAHVANLVELHSPETCIDCVNGRGFHQRVLAIHDWERRRRVDARRLYLNGIVPAVVHVEASATADGSLYANRLAEAMRRDAQRIGTAFGALIDHTNEPCQVEPLISGQVRIAPAVEPPALDSPNWRDIGHVREGFSFGFDPATRDSGGSMVAVTRRGGVDHVEAFFSPGIAVFPLELVEHMRAVNEQIGQAWTDAWRNISNALEPLAEQLQRSGLIEEQPPTDPRERALWLRRNRNTGPAASARAPRTINPRRGR